jgi:hypothetical protein
MSDAEWNSWQSSWSGAAGPLPDVRARARREARVHRLAMAAFFLLVLAALPGAWVAFSAPEPPVHAIGWMILAFLATMSIGYLMIQRGIGLHRIGNPRDALGFLERRLRVERLTAQLVRWAYAGLCAAFVILFPRLVADHSSPQLELSVSFTGMALVFLVTFSAPWWVARRNRPRVEELGRWRRWMDEQQI